MIDLAIINATILPMGGRPRIDDGVVTISGNSITAVGPAS